MSATRRRRLSFSTQRSIAGFLFALPALLFFTTLSLYPMINAFYISLFKYDLVSTPTFVGLGNYQSLLTDNLFANSIRATLIYVVGSTFPTWIISLVVALVLSDRILPRTGAFQTILVMPVATSLIALTIIWRLMYSDAGPINAVMIALTGNSISWLNSSTWAMAAVIVFSVWRVIGYYAILFLVGLRNIPFEYYEAAACDGATGIHAFRHLTWPLLKPTTVFVIIISIINSLRHIDAFFVMTNGGPGDSTRVLALLLYETAFSYLKMGLASAISIFLFIAIFVFTLLQLRLFRSEA